MIPSINEFYNAALGYLVFNFGLKYSPNFPNIFAIETSSLCNLNCVMCPREIMTRPKINMPFDIFKSAVEQIGNRQRRIILHLGGEPLLNKQLPDLIAYAHQHSLITVLSTNGTIMNEAIAAKLINSGLDQLIIALDSLDPQKYESIRVGANYEKVMANITTFSQMSKRLNTGIPEVVIQKVSDLEDHSVDMSFKHFWEAKGYRVFIKELQNWDNVIDVKGRLNQKRRLPCYLPWYSCVILADGTVSPCCIDFDGKLALGNIQDKPLTEIWNDAPARNLRKEHMEGTFNPVCANCLEFETRQSPLFFLSKSFYSKIYSFLINKYS